MVSNSTQQFLIQMQDNQLDFNIKVITFAILIAYWIILYYIQKTMIVDRSWKLGAKLAIRVMLAPAPFFLPLIGIMLMREYSFITMWTNIIVAYGILFVILAGLALVFQFEFMLRLFGINVSPQAFKQNKLLDWESTDSRWSDLLGK